MGNTFTKLLYTFFGIQEMQVVMIGLDVAGKTTILYKLHGTDIVTPIPTKGFNVENIQYKNVLFTVYELGGGLSRPLPKHYLNIADALIFVLDTADRDRLGDAVKDFQLTVEDPLMRNSAILIFANKQDLPGAYSTAEVTEAFQQLGSLKGRKWHVQSSSATRGEGLYEGLDWLSATVKPLRQSGVSTSVSSASR